LSYDIDEDGNKVFNEVEPDNKPVYEYLVKFKGTIYIEATSEEEAEEKAKDKVDLVEYIDIWDVD